jgi:hypothetical protein
MLINQGTMTMPKLSPSDTALAIKAAADKYGFQLEVRGGILTVHKSFTPGSNDGFVECDMMYGSVLGLLPRTSPGSDFGTDGGGIGGMVALQSGRFKMNRTGGSLRVLKALEKLM